MGSRRFAGIRIVVWGTAALIAFCWVLSLPKRPAGQNIRLSDAVTLAIGRSEPVAQPIGDVEGQKEPVSQGVAYRSGAASSFHSVSRSGSSIPPSVRDIVVRVKGPGAVARLSAVHALGDRLNDQEREALYSYLLDPSCADDLTRDEKYVLVNEIMKKLRQQQDHAPEFGDVLSAVYRDRNQDSVVRDYALQHLGEWCLLNDWDVQWESVFLEALSESDASIAGTSLVALDKLDVEWPELSPAMVEDAALVLASDESANKGSRAVALAVCGARGITNALPVARKSAQEVSIPLRLASIAYVGSYGQVEDQAWLVEITADAPAVIVASAKAAIERIAVRGGNNSHIMQ